MTTLGDYIAKLREEKGWSQKELARRAGRSQTTIHKIETGLTLHPGIDILVDIAKALNISVHLLVLAYEGQISKNWRDLQLQALKEDVIQNMESVFSKYSGKLQN